MQIAEADAKYQSEKQEKEIAQQKAEIEKKNAVRNRLIMGFIVILISLTSVFVFYNQKKKRQADASAKQIETHLREIEILRSNVRMEIEESQSKLKVSLQRGELNQYLLNPLSDRELEVLFLISDGKTKREVADELFVSVNTVKSHVIKIFDKLGVNNKLEAYVKASNLEILNPV